MFLSQRAHFAPLERGSSFPQHSYKHFAALRRADLCTYLVHGFGEALPTKSIAF